MLLHLVLVDNYFNPKLRGVDKEANLETLQCSHTS